MATRKKDTLIYLAAPFTHKDQWVKSLRNLIITTIGAKLISEGYHIFSPITESAEYVKFFDNITTDWEFWQEHDCLMLDRCDQLWVLTLKGWKESIGVTAEIEYAKQKNKLIRYINPLTILPELKEVL